MKRRLTPPWPPAWNPFEVFLLVLSVVSSIGLLQGHSGSSVLDERLPGWVVGVWGAGLALGSLTALTGVICYRRVSTLMIGLYCERTGLILVGGMAAIYSYVIVATASDVSGVRWSATVQIAYAAACFYRAFQDTRAIRRALNLHSISTDLDRGMRDLGKPDGGGGDAG